LAHSRQWDQATFSDVLALHAAREISKQTIINNARNTELAKLGTMAPQRIDAVKQWAHGTFGSALSGAIEQMLVSARDVEAFEKIISNVSRQGGNAIRTERRDVDLKPAGSIPGYETMSFAQKRAAQMRSAPPPGAPGGPAGRHTR
jgi:hypothetical protein